MSGMKWMDLGRHGLQLGIVEQSRGPVLCVQGGVQQHAVDLDALGFVETPEVGWVREDLRVSQGFWQDLKARFPLSSVVEVSVDRLFFRVDTAAPVQAPAVPIAPARAHPHQVSYVTAGEHRGKRRLWMEGMRLERAGFVPGARYVVSLDLDRRRLTLSIDPDGERSVSSRTRKQTGKTSPIIDLADASLEQVLGPSGRMVARVYEGRIECDLHPVDRAIEHREARAREHVRDGRVTEGVLCAGGGISTAATQEGFAEAGLDAEVVWVADREGSYLQSAIDNNPAVRDALIFEASLEELDPALVPGVDVVQVSLPCTGHSLSGKAKRGIACAEEHPTDALAVYGALKTIEAANPAVVISENVKQAQSSATYALIRAYLQAQGYAIAERVLSGEDAGTIEQRERYWLVAVSNGLAAGFSLAQLPARERTHATLGDVMEPVAHDSPAWAANTYLADKATRDAAAGKGFARQFVGPDSTAVGTIGRGYYKRRSTEPFIKREDGMERLLTPVEHARVKGIPEQLIADLSAQLAHEILGQSILYGHATALAAHVGAHLRRAVGSATEMPLSTTPAQKARKGMSL